MAARVAGGVVDAIAVGAIDVIGIVVLAALPTRATVLLEVVVHLWHVRSIGIVWLSIGCSRILIGIVSRAREGLLLSMICATSTSISSTTIIVVLLLLRLRLRIAVSIATLTGGCVYHPSCIAAVILLFSRRDAIVIATTAIYWLEIVAVCTTETVNTIISGIIHSISTVMAAGEVLVCGCSGSATSSTGPATIVVFAYATKLIRVRAATTLITSGVAIGLHIARAASSRVVASAVATVPRVLRPL